MTIKQEILSQIDETIRQIDIAVETILHNFKNDLAMQISINSKRDIFLKEINCILKEISSVNVNATSDQVNFKSCFFIPKSNLDSKCESREAASFGKLVILNQLCSLNVVNHLIETFANEEKVNIKIDIFCQCKHSIATQSDKELVQFYVLLILIMRKIDKMDIIDLSNAENNILKYINFRQLRPSNFKPLTQFTIDSFLAIGSFINMKNLECLLIGTLGTLRNKNNVYVNVKLNDFNRFNFCSLRQLEIQNSNFECIPSKFFQNMPNLEVLVLMGNNTKEIEDDAFYGLNHLSRLNLSYNCIERLTSKMFNGLDNLIILELKNNILSRADDESFSFITNLKILDLNNNTLFENFQSFYNLRKLVFLNIQNTGVKKIHSSVLNRLEKLEYLNLRSNSNVKGDFQNFELYNLKFIVMPIGQLPTFKGIESIKVLDLQIQSRLVLDKKLIDQYPNLKHLKLNFEDESICIDDSYFNYLSGISFIIVVVKCLTRTIINEKIWHENGYQLESIPYLSYLNMEFFKIIKTCYLKEIVTFFEKLDIDIQIKKLLPYTWNAVILNS